MADSESHDRWTAVDGYLTDLLVRADNALEAALETSAAGGLPAISVSPNQGKLLHLLARIRGARRILEIGTLGGYSTIWLARALPGDGHLVTLEIDPAYAEIARTNITRAGVEKLVELRLGPASDSLRDLAAEGVAPFDLVFIDANKEDYADYLVGALKLAAPGTVIIADNIVRDGEVINASSDDPRVAGVRRFNDLVAGETRLSATAMQTVGSKGYDGFVLALVNS